MYGNLQRFWAWGAVIGMAVFLPIGIFVLGKYIPPHDPSASAQMIADHYIANINSIRAGLMITMLGSMTLFPLVGLYFAQLRRIEKARGEPALNATIQLIGGATGNLLGGVIPLLIWMAAAFRPDRDPELILLLNDLGWIFFVLPFASFMVQNLAIGIGILRDNQPVPLFPRWLGWMNLWVILTAVAAFLVPFFKTGPFAWNGIIAFWIPLPIFGAYMVVMLVYLFKAIRRDDYPA